MQDSFTNQLSDYLTRVNVRQQKINFFKKNPSFSITILLLITTALLPINNPFFYLSYFLLSYFIFLRVIKTIPAISTNTPFLYTSFIFQLPIFTHHHPYNLHQFFFLPDSSHSVNLGCVQGPMNKEVI